jgi:hypothetical protein
MRSEAPAAVVGEGGKERVRVRERVRGRRSDNENNKKGQGVKAEKESEGERERGTNLMSFSANGPNCFSICAMEPPDTYSSTMKRNRSLWAVPR